MKFNLSKLSLIILTSVTLVACGSSNTQPAEQVSLKRVGFEVNKEDKTVTVIERQIHDDNNVNVVNVEGQEIEIIPSGYYERPVIGTNEKEVLQADSPELRSISGKNYKNIRWGKFTEPTLGSDYYVAFGVNPTTEMPQSGTANYIGNGMHVETRADGLDSNLSFVKLTANFADKTLNGTISLAKTGYKDVLVSNGIAGGALSPNVHFDDVSLSAKIQGNQFSGTNSQGVQVEGGFYGKDADEVAGTYQGNDKFGVFGARKN